MPLSHQENFWNFRWLVLIPFPTAASPTTDTDTAAVPAASPTTDTAPVPAAVPDAVPVPFRL